MYWRVVHICSVKLVKGFNTGTIGVNINISKNKKISIRPWVYKGSSVKLRVETSIESDEVTWDMEGVHQFCIFKTQPIKYLDKVL